MTAKTSLYIALCGGMLMGCSSLTDGGLAFKKIPPRIVMTADGEYQRGKQLHLQGQYADAQKAYLSALAIDPDHDGAKNGMAALIGASGDIDRAIGMLVELAQRQPQSHVYANLGHAYQMKGRDYDARDAYQRALELDPGNTNVQQKLQALEQKLGATEIVAAPMPAEAGTATPQPDKVTIDSVTEGIYAMRYPVVPVEDPVPSVVALPEPPATDNSVQMQVHQVTAGRTEPRPRARDRLPTVELVNGNGVTGLARQLRALLPADEWKVVRTTNHADFRVRQTRIEYVPASRPVARRLAADIGMQPSLRPNNELVGTRLRVVLGHDCKDLESLKPRLAALIAQPAS